MNKDLVIATGWYSDGKPTNAHTSMRCYKRSWLELWGKYHLDQTNRILPLSIYQSSCGAQHDLIDLKLYDNISYATIDNNKYHTRHDWWSSLLSGAMYAYNNDLHLVYIEQDCLVKGLDKAIEYALKEDFPLYYGFGEYSFAPGWAENSFMFVRKEFVPTLISLVINSQADRTIRPILEIIFHELFQDYYKPWPFGYGRKPVTDWNQEILYKQQLTDEDLKHFLI